MATFNLTNTSAYEVLTDDLQKVVTNVVDADSTSVFPNFIDVSNKIERASAKKFVGGIFLIDSVEESWITRNTYECVYDCYAIFQNVKDFKDNLNRILAKLHADFNTTSLTSDHTSDPLEQKFEIVTINRNTDLPDKLMEANQASPYWVANIIVRGSKLGR